MPSPIVAAIVLVALGALLWFAWGRRKRIEQSDIASRPHSTPFSTTSDQIDANSTSRVLGGGSVVPECEPKIFDNSARDDKPETASLPANAPLAAAESAVSDSTNDVETGDEPGAREAAVEDSIDPIFQAAHGSPCADETNAEFVLGSAIDISVEHDRQTRTDAENKFHSDNMADTGSAMALGLGLPEAEKDHSVHELKTEQAARSLSAFDSDAALSVPDAKLPGDHVQEQGSPESVDAPTQAESSQEDAQPPRYRAPQLGPPKAGKDKTSQPSLTQSRQAFELCVQALLDRHGLCRFRLLAERPPYAPARIDLTRSRSTVSLCESGDSWYEVAMSRSLADVLEHGLAFSVDSQSESKWRWLLKGRDIYVFSGVQGIAGLVSCPRLSIGREQMVFCREARASEVEQILSQAGSGAVIRYGEDKGSPTGWVFFKPVHASRSIPQVPGDDILNVLRPLPDIELVLEDGLWLRGSVWLNGYPPKICVSGELPEEESVLIDGKTAVTTDGRIYCTPTSDSPGEHSVWCCGKFITYSITEPEINWEPWAAHPFPRGTICGAMATLGSNEASSLVTVPMTNPVLIGAGPGQIYVCDFRPGKQWTGFAPFPVAWALPQEPLHCDRTFCHIVLVTQIAPTRYSPRLLAQKRQASSLWAWSQAIRDCCRKRLALIPSDMLNQQLWKAYAREAKAVWRSTR